MTLWTRLTERVAANRRPDAIDVAALLVNLRRRVDGLETSVAELARQHEHLDGEARCVVDVDEATPWHPRVTGDGACGSCRGFGCEYCAGTGRADQHAPFDHRVVVVSDVAVTYAGEFVDLAPSSVSAPHGVAPASRWPRKPADDH